MRDVHIRRTALAALFLGAAGLTGLAAPAQAATSPSAPTVKCDTTAARNTTGYQRDRFDDVSKAVADKVQRQIDGAANARVADRRRQKTFVPVRAHIVLGRRGEGHATKRQVRSQIQHMNFAYSGREGGTDTKIRFRLRSISVTKNSGFFHARTVRTFNRMKNKLHRGGRNSLNIYFIDLARSTGGLLGYSTFPFQAKRLKKRDGVIITYDSMPGGALSPYGYGEGDTAVHEVGHWLGLFHPFQGGCTPPGDYVADTPYQGQPVYQCVASDTCAQPGLDPVNNFVGYAFDSCMNQFTPGQKVRMKRMWARFR